MAEGDPQLGKPDTWKGHVITLSTQDDPLPTLYHAEPSYFSQVARLVLEEEGIKYRSRGVDIHSSMEQLEPWYLHISPAGLVPTLVYRGRPMVESRHIAMFVVDELTSEHRLLPVEGGDRNKVLDLVEAHYTLDVEKLSFGTMLSSNKLMAVVMPRKMKGAIEKLEEVKKKHPELEAVIDKKIEVKREQMKMGEDPLGAKEKALSEVEKVLDQLEMRMKESGEEFLVGANYSLADALFTCLLARLSMIHLLEGELAGRPSMAAWWVRVKGRQSFKNTGIVSEGITAGFLVKKLCTIL